MLTNDLSDLNTESEQEPQPGTSNNLSNRKGKVNYMQLNTSKTPRKQNE